MLPTEKASNLLLTSSRKQIMLAPYNTKWQDKNGKPSGNCQYLYILSDDEKKEGDWCYISGDHLGRRIDKWTDGIESFTGNGIWKKIIATTDSSLKLPLIPNYFIKEYCEMNGKIEEVMIEYKFYDIERAKVKGVEFDFFEREENLPPVIKAKFDLIVTSDNYINITKVKLNLIDIIELVKAEQDFAVEQQNKELNKSFYSGVEHACNYVLSYLNQLV